MGDRAQSKIMKLDKWEYTKNKSMVVRELEGQIILYPDSGEANTYAGVHADFLAGLTATRVDYALTRPSDEYGVISDYVIIGRTQLCKVEEFAELGALVKWQKAWQQIETDIPNIKRWFSNSGFPLNSPEFDTGFYFRQPDLESTDVPPQLLIVSQWNCNVVARVFLRQAEQFPETPVFIPR